MVSGNNVSLNDTGALSIASAAVSANFTLTAAGAVDLGPSTVGGALSVTTTGAITDSGALAVTGTTSLSSTGGAGGIAVDTAANDFTGVVTLSSAGVTDISFRDTNNASLAALAAGNNLTLSAGGTITMLGALSTGQDLDIASGTLNLNNNNLDVNRHLTGGRGSGGRRGRRSGSDQRRRRVHCYRLHGSRQHRHPGWKLLRQPRRASFQQPGLQQGRIPGRHPHLHRRADGSRAP